MSEQPMKTRGFSILETVVALALTGTVLLGVTTLFAKSSKTIKSSKSLTEATSIGTDIMEELNRMSYSQMYKAFGGTATQTSLTVSTLTNSYATRWQPRLNALLRSPAYPARGTITFTPLGGATSPPQFGTAKVTRVLVRLDWLEGTRPRHADFVTLRASR